MYTDYRYIFTYINGASSKNTKRKNLTETKQTQAKPNITPQIIKTLDNLIQSSSAGSYLVKVREKYVQGICR